MLWLQKNYALFVQLKNQVSGDDKNLAMIYKKKRTKLRWKSSLQLGEKQKKEVWFNKRAHLEDVRKQIKPNMR